MFLTRFIGDYGRKARSWLRLYGWLALDAARSMKFLVLVVVGLSFVGVLTRASTYGAVLLFARSVESERPLRLGPVAIPVAADLRSLLLWAGLVLAVGFSSAVIVYLAKSLSLRAGNRYEVKATGRLLALIARSPRLQTEEPGDLGAASFLSRLVRSDTRFMRRSYELMLDLAVPGIQFLVWAVVLLKTDAYLTLVVVGISLFYLVPFYMVNREAARHSRDYEAVLSDASIGSIPSVLHRFLHAEAPPDPGETWKERVFAHGAAQQMLRAYRGRLIVAAKNDLFSDVFFGVCLACILLVFGFAVLMGRRYWSDFATFVVALRFAQVSLKAFTSKIAVMSRFQPQIARYRRFMRRHPDRIVRGAASPPRLPLEVRADAPALEGGAGPVRVGAGQALVCLVAQRPSRHGLAEGLPALLRGACPDAIAALGAVAFHARTSHLLPGDILYNLVGNAGEGEAAAAEDALRRLGVLDALQALPGGLRTAVDDPAVESLPPDARYAVSLMPCLLSPKPFLALEVDGLGEASPAFEQRLAELLGEKVVLLVGTRPQDAPAAFHPQGCAIVDATRVVGCGDMAWYGQRRAEIARYLEAMHERRGGGPADEDDLDALTEEV